MKRADNKNKGDPQEMSNTIASPHVEITPVNIVDTSSDYPYPPQESEASQAPTEPKNPSGSGTQTGNSAVPLTRASGSLPASTSRNTVASEAKAGLGNPAVPPASVNSSSGAHTGLGNPAVPSTPANDSEKSKSKNPGIESPAMPGDQATENPVLKNATSENLATPAPPVYTTFPTAMAEQAEKTNPKKGAKIIPVTDTEYSSGNEEKQPASDMRGSIQASGPEGSTPASPAQQEAAEDLREWSKETRLS